MAREFLLDGHDSRSFERALAWGRYVYWADVECKQYDVYEPTEDEPTTGLSFVLMLQWYAALYVAIEAWNRSGLSDCTVEDLLTDSAFANNLNLLRHFRNGVYHFQESLVKRLAGFLADASRTVPWAFLVHSEFKRVLWEISHPVDLPAQCREEMADSIRDLIGWLPSNIAEAAPGRAERRYREVSDMISADGQQDSPEAKALLSAAKKFRSQSHRSSTAWTEYKRTLIISLKKAAQNNLPT